MTLDSTYLIGLLLTCASVACLLFMWLADWRANCYLRRESSRFPMFAARDALVELIADGEMSESDHPWVWSYRSVNMILRMHQKWHLSRVVWTYARYVARLSSNPSERRRVEDMKAKMKKACETHPEFAKVQDRIGEAFGNMIRARTSFCHRTFLWVFIVVLAGLAATLHLSVSVALAVVRAFMSPVPGDLAGYAAARAEA